VILTLDTVTLNICSVSAVSDEIDAKLNNPQHCTCSLSMSCLCAVAMLDLPEVEYNLIAAFGKPWCSRLGLCVPSC